jgi:hypothetical protein
MPLKNNDGLNASSYLHETESFTGGAQSSLRALGVPTRLRPSSANEYRKHYRYTRTSCSPHHTSDK